MADATADTNSTSSPCVAETLGGRWPSLEVACKRDVTCSRKCLAGSLPRPPEVLEVLEPEEKEDVLEPEVMEEFERAQSYAELGEQVALATARGELVPPWVGLLAVKLKAWEDQGVELPRLGAAFTAKEPDVDLLMDEGVGIFEN